MMRREILIALSAGVLAAPLAAIAQQQRVYRIGFLGNKTGRERHVDAFRLGLRERGWFEGENIVIEYRWADGYMVDQYPTLAAEIGRASCRERV